MSLAELQGELWDVCAIDVSVQTVLWTLQQEGYTMKLVCFPFHPVLVEHSYL